MVYRLYNRININLITEEYSQVKTTSWVSLVHGKFRTEEVGFVVFFFFCLSWQTEGDMF